MEPPAEWEQLQNDSQITTNRVGVRDRSDVCHLPLGRRSECHLYCRQHLWQNIKDDRQRFHFERCNVQPSFRMLPTHSIYRHKHITNMTHQASTGTQPILQSSVLRQTEKQKVKTFKEIQIRAQASNRRLLIDCMVKVGITVGTTGWISQQIRKNKLSSDSNHATRSPFQPCSILRERNY
jgi:hypothetical protein